MTYAYVIVIYGIFIQIYYYCLLGHGLPKDLWKEIFCIMISLATLYIIKFDVCYLLVNMCNYHATAESNTLPLYKRETPSIVLLLFASFSYISLWLIF